jgi:hypothetical protein
MRVLRAPAQAGRSGTMHPYRAERTTLPGRSFVWKAGRSGLASSICGGWHGSSHTGSKSRKMGDAPGSKHRPGRCISGGNARGVRRRADVQRHTGRGGPPRETRASRLGRPSRLERPRQAGTPRKGHLLRSLLRSLLQLRLQLLQLLALAMRLLVRLAHRRLVPVPVASRLLARREHAHHAGTGHSRPASNAGHRRASGTRRTRPGRVACAVGASTRSQKSDACWFEQPAVPACLASCQQKGIAPQW